MAPPYVFAVFRHEGEHATTLWIFVNYNTSNAADLQHQNEYSVQALSSNMSSKLCLDTILSLTLDLDLQYTPASPLRKRNFQRAPGFLSPFMDPRPLS